MARFLAQNRIFFMFFCATIFSSIVARAQAIDGVFTVVKGDVKVQQPSTRQIVKAKIGQKVYPQDTIITARDSRAKIVMVDNNVINVLPSSKFAIKTYQYKPSQNKKNVLLNVLYGKIRTTVQQKYHGKTKFRVETPSAVAGVRGTDFITSYDQSSNTSSILTFRGSVEFGQPGPNGQISHSVFVSAGRMSQLIGFKPPTTPAQMSNAFMAKMNNDSNADVNSTRQPATAPDNNTPGSNTNDDHHHHKRNPASISMGASNSMLLPGDLPSLSNPPPPGAMPGANFLPQPSVPFLPPPTNDFVHNVLLNSATKRVNVIVTGP